MRRSLRSSSALLAFAMAIALGAGPAPAPSPAPRQEQVEITEALVVGGVTRSRRTPIRVDPVEAALLRGTFTPPTEGSTIEVANGGEPSTLTWTKVTAGDDGFLRHEGLRGGYAFVSIESDAPRAMLLEATCHGMAYVNGEPRVGDPYQYGSTILPIELRQGTNTLLFSTSRGVLRAKLTPLPEPPRPTLERRDMTVPDLIAGDEVSTVAGVMVVNPTSAPLRGAVIRASVSGAPPVESPVPELPPFGIVKAPVRLAGPAPKEPGVVPVTLELFDHAPAASPPDIATAPVSGGAVDGSAPTAAPNAAAAVSQLTFDLHAVDGHAMRRETFTSSIDGSAQYFAVQPAAPGADEPPGILLSLHGASVEASGQAAAYQRKPWAHVVAPTNRRPFGFDWEDWGRLDAIEVHDLARARLPNDPRRHWVTGHSMGGHGAWQLAVHFPDRFAAVAPSAAWVAFPPGGPDTDPAHPIGAIFARAALPSRTLELRENLARLGVSILHGDADDNVAVSNARTMRSALAEFHGDFVYHEQPGAGHWWGNECMDWPAFGDFLRARSLVPAEARSPLVFVTASPSVSARCDWALVDAQKSPFEPSRIELARDVGARRVSGATVNVERLAIDLPKAGFAPDAPVRVELDGTTLADLAWPADGRLWLEWSEGNDGAAAGAGARADSAAAAGPAAGAWRVTAPPGPLVKHHLRTGPFKDAFRNRMIFVYGTRGTPEENAIQRAKARFDAENFWYRGNGAVPVIADGEFDPAKFADRNVILYGNAETNAAWDELLSESPVQVTRTGVRIGARTIPGDDLCCLFVRPRPDSAIASVAAVSGTGIAGLRLSERMPYFVSGVGYPDVTVIGADMLERGIDGVRAAGWFGNDWSLERGTIAYMSAP